MDSQFWTQVESTCAALSTDIYLPPHIESHLKHTVSPHHQPKSYPFRLRLALQSAEHLFRPDGEVRQAENAFSALDSQLEAIEHRFVNLVSSLEMSSEAVRNSVHHRIQLTSNAVVTSDEARSISDFVQPFVLPDHLQQVIQSSNPHSREFQLGLEPLSRALVACNFHKHTLSAQQVHQFVLSLRDIAIRRIHQRFQESFRLMRDPASTFMILRDTLLLKQKPLVDFVRRHAIPCFEALTTEYIDIAKLAFSVHVRSHFRLLAPSVSNRIVLDRGSFSIQDRTSGMLSSIWDYAAAVTKLSDTGGALMSQGIQQPAIQHSHQLATMTREHIKLLSDRCADVMRASLSPPLTTADFHLKGNTLSFSLSGLIRELAALFLSYEKSESRFVSSVFDGDDRGFLADIFSDNGSPVLSCVEEGIQSSGFRSKPEELCLSLYICRRIREGIVTQRIVDHRISVFVQIERIIQTHLLSALDLRASEAKELLLRRGRDEAVQAMVATGMTRFSLLVSTLLVIALQGDKWIDAQDVGYALRRRLHSCVDMVLAAGDRINWEDSNIDYRFKIYLYCLTDLLSTLDICQSLDAHHHGSDDLHRLLKEHFSRGCKSYAMFIEKHRLTELDLIESSVSLLSVDDVEKHCLALLDKLKETELRVREGMKFLKNDKVGGAYENEAVKGVLTFLHRRTEALKQMLSIHHSGLSAMLDW